MLTCPVQDEFGFGPVYIGALAKLPLTLVNTTPVPAKLLVDMVSNRLSLFMRTCML